MPRWWRWDIAIGPIETCGTTSSSRSSRRAIGSCATTSGAMGRPAGPPSPYILEDEVDDVAALLMSRKSIGFTIVELPSAA